MRLLFALLIYPLIAFAVIGLLATPFIRLRAPVAPPPPRPPSWLSALVLTLLAVTAVPGFAVAATVIAPASPVIDLAPIVNNVLAPLLTSILLALASWAIAKAAAYFHIQVQASQRQVVNDAIANAIAYAEQMLAGKEQVAANDKVSTAVNYLLPKIPDALKALNITPEHLGQLVTARLGTQP